MLLDFTRIEKLRGVYLALTLIEFIYLLKDSVSLLCGQKIKNSMEERNKSMAYLTEIYLQNNREVSQLVCKLASHNRFLCIKESGQSC